MLNDWYQQARAFLVGRAGSYARVFDPQTADGRVVLADLARFCRAHVSTAAADPVISARLDGRREVWLRIQQHTQLNNDTLWLLFDGRPPPNPLKGNDE